MKHSVGKFLLQNPAYLENTAHKLALGHRERFVSFIVDRVFYFIPILQHFSKLMPVLRDVREHLLQHVNKNDKDIAFINAFILTHPDQDHCRGFQSAFYTGPPSEYPEEAKNSELIFKESDDEDTLKWDLLRAPHYCSWTFYNDHGESEPHPGSLELLKRHRDGAFARQRRQAEKLVAAFFPAR